MKYIRDDKIIEASPKAYRTIYKEQGYIPYEVPEETEKEGQEEDNAEIPDLDDMKMDELKALAKEKGIKGFSSLTKDELLAVLKGVI